ncbi:MAG: antibiotic biosynthesis monooxygenase [Kangiellaceae bacterium]|nr:antibiotic biosynthesis monooxygenase [Kangiellaceae bacterium]
MIRVIIERNIRQGRIDDYLELSRRARKRANTIDGFIAGELLQEKTNPNLAIIISSWEDYESWSNWAEAKERLEVMEEMKPLLETEERVVVLENSHILG